jgi:hypothetical protein
MADMVLPFNNGYCLPDHVFGSTVNDHLEELGIVYEFIAHHELELELIPDLMRERLIFTNSKLNQIRQIIIEICGAAPELSEFVDLDVTWFFASSFVDFKHLCFFVVVNEVIVGQFINHIPSRACGWQVNV